MTCPTCAPGPARHSCGLCDRERIPPHLGGDPLEDCEPCPACATCRLGIRIPPAPGAEGVTAARLEASGLGWRYVAALIYGDDSAESIERAREAARKWRRRGAL